MGTGTLQNDMDISYNIFHGARARSEVNGIKWNVPAKIHILLKASYIFAGPWCHHPLAYKLRDHKRNNNGTPKVERALYILVYVDALWQIGREK